MRKRAEKRRRTRRPTGYSPRVTWFPVVEGQETSVRHLVLIFRLGTSLKPIKTRSSYGRDSKSVEQTTPPEVTL